MPRPNTVTVEKRDDWTGEYFEDALHTSDVAEHFQFTTLTQGTIVGTLIVGPSTQFRLRRVSWFADGEARLALRKQHESGTLDAHYLQAAGEESHEGLNVEEPYLTIQEGTLEYFAIPEVGTVDRVGVNHEGRLHVRGDEERL